MLDMRGSDGDLQEGGRVSKTARYGAIHACCEAWSVWCRRIPGELQKGCRPGIEGVLLYETGISFNKAEAY